MNRIRRLVSESKKFITESCQRWLTCHAGHGRHRLYEHFSHRKDIPGCPAGVHLDRTSEVMAMIAAHEWYRNAIKESRPVDPRHEGDAPEAEAQEEKIYE